MDRLYKLENKILNILKPIPHLPANWIKWMTDNAWWLIIISGTGLIITVLYSINGIMNALSIIGLTTGYTGRYFATNYSYWWVFSALVSVIFYILSAIAMLLAVNPLRNLKKKGWDLLFLSFVILVISSFVSLVLNFNFFTFIPGVIFTGLWSIVYVYFLFEIRLNFNSVKIIRKKK